MTERAEFNQLRNDIYAAELSRCPVPVDERPTRREVEDDGDICIMCGKPAKRICQECQEE